jgi:hypothetical protein
VVGKRLVTKSKEAFHQSTSSYLDVFRVFIALTTGLMCHAVAPLEVYFILLVVLVNVKFGLEIKDGLKF